MLYLAEVLVLTHLLGLEGEGAESSEPCTGVRWRFGACLWRLRREVPPGFGGRMGPSSGGLFAGGTDVAAHLGRSEFLAVFPVLCI